MSSHHDAFLRGSRTFGRRAGTFPNPANPFRRASGSANGPVASEFCTGPTRAGYEENLAENPPDLHERPAEVSLQECSPGPESTARWELGVRDALISRGGRLEPRAG